MRDPQKLATRVIADTWKYFLLSREEAFRNELATHYLPLVKKVSYKVYSTLPSSVDPGDLYSCGVFGLFDAIEKFDPERGVKFETYAIPRIKGAILDELRAMDWIPRSLRSKARAVETATVVTGHEGTAADVAEEMGITEPQLHGIIGEVWATGAVYLDGHVDPTEDSPTLGEMIVSHRSSEEYVNLRWMSDSIAHSIEKLQERERFLLVLYYYESLTLAQIGVILGVTESRICQLHTKACKVLQSNLALKP